MRHTSISSVLSPVPIALAVAALLAGALPAADWPQWRGPERTGHSGDTHLLRSWPQEGPPLLWKADGLGTGYSTPSVAGGRIFTMGDLGDQECVLALEEKTGKRLWAAALGAVRANGGGYPGPRCTPTVDGERVYALGLAGTLVCLDAATGREQWRHDLVADFAGSPGNWGYSESPLVDGDRLIVTPGGAAATLVALDRKTGRVVWKAATEQGDSAAYASCIAVEADGQRQYVQFLSGGVVGVSADRGQVLWRYNRPANGTANCATPVFGDGCVFAASSYGAGGGLVRLTRDDTGTRATEVYATRALKNHHGNMVLVDGYLYGSDDPATLVCLEFRTGRVMWAERRPGKGSIAYADGRLYYRNETGPVLLIEANPQRYVEHGYLTPPRAGDGPAWPHPVIASGRLYLRDQDMLLCYDVRRP